MNKWYSNITGVVSGLVGGGLLLFLYFSMQINPLVAGLLGIIGFIGTYLFLNALKPTTEFTFEPGSELTAELLESTLNEGHEKIKILIQYANRINNQNVRAKILEIVEIVKKIFENFKKNPKDVKNAKQFLAYYFDTCIKIVKKYSELSSQNVRSPEIEKTLLKAENMLNSIEKAFEKQQAKLLRDDVMDLDVEIETLERTFSAEDLK
jgi:5-bromo-4-chloroindolyl phosphate hydrolysis protein